MQKHKLKTKIVCTIGPASWDPKVLEKMVKNGMRIARVNASFADKKEINRVAKLVRSVSKDVALMLDTKGHKIRVSDFKDPIHLRKGDTFVLDNKENDKHIWVTYKSLYKQVKKGTTLLLDDGKIELEVTGTDDTRIITKVKNGGILTRSKTLNVIGTHVDFPALTKKDKEDIKSAIAAGYDFVSASFVRSAHDVFAIQRVTRGSDIKIMSKIENEEGIENIDQIIDMSFGIMVARGDLGVELPFEQTTLLQKEIVAKCNAKAKPVIVATQMLESMIENPTPTRAEVSDITNAVIDGADAIMLSAETSTGEYPAECVEVMKKVAMHVEANLDPLIIAAPADAPAETNAIAEAVAEVCDKLGITKILVATASGRTARVISRHNPTPPIYAFTKNAAAKRGLNMTKGVYAYVMKAIGEKNKRITSKRLVRQAYKKGIVSKSDLVAVVAGTSVKMAGSNMLEIVNAKTVLD